MPKNNQILKKVKDDYNTIAPYFSDTRNYNWSEFEDFKKYIKPEMKVLDLGCGNGRFFNFLKDSKINYIGIDNSEGILKQAKIKHPEQNFKFGDILDIPEQNEEFDVVFCIAALHHIPHEYRTDALKEIKRVLKPEGYFIMTNWNLWQKKYLPLILKSTFKKFGDVYIPWYTPKGKLIARRYYHAFTKMELSRLADKSNFKIIEQYYTKRNIVSIYKK